MISRRALLVTGAASVLVLGAGYGGLVAKSSITKARAPWREAAKGFGDVRLNAAAYAILAPSPHNLQPWQIRLNGSDRLTLYCDLARRLPQTDPPDRQTTIGLGAFLELLRQAAAEQGYRAEIEPFPDGEPGERLDARPIAHVRFAEEVATPKDPLFGLVLARRTNRQAYTPGRPVAAETIDRLQAAALAGPGLEGCAFSATSEAGTVSRLKALCLRGWEIEITKPETWQESLKLTRIGAKQVIDNPDGISLHGPMLEALGMAGILTTEEMAKPGTTAANSTKTFYDGLIEHSPTLAWLITGGNSRREQLAAGAAWVRYQLAAAREGVAFQPLSQILQEFPEMAGPYAEVHEHFAIEAPGRIQGLFRLGYAPQAAASPRWPLHTRLIT